VSETLADDLRDGDCEAFGIGLNLAVFMLPMIVAECLLIGIAEQVKRLHGNIGSTDPTLKQAPEVLTSVCMDSPTNILNCVIDDLMLKLVVQSIVGQQFIGECLGTLFNVRRNVIVEFLLAPSGNHFRLGNLLTSARRARNSVRPALGHHVVKAVLRVREECDCVFKSVWCLNFHVPVKPGPVKYIFTKTRQLESAE
jgi:hypothetical protein